MCNVVIWWLLLCCKLLVGGMVWFILKYCGVRFLLSLPTVFLLNSPLPSHFSSIRVLDPCLFRSMDIVQYKNNHCIWLHCCVSCTFVAMPMSLFVVPKTLTILLIFKTYFIPNDLSYRMTRFSKYNSGPCERSTRRTEGWATISAVIYYLFVFFDFYIRGSISPAGGGLAEQRWQTFLQFFFLFSKGEWGFLQLRLSYLWEFKFYLQKKNFSFKTLRLSFCHCIQGKYICGFLSVFFGQGHRISVPIAVWLKDKEGWEKSVFNRRDNNYEMSNKCN